MTDADREALARKWCERMGKRPYRFDTRDGKEAWRCDGLLSCLTIYWDWWVSNGVFGWNSERSFYIALGKALDQLFREVPDVALIDAARRASRVLRETNHDASADLLDIELARYEGIK